MNPHAPKGGTLRLASEGTYDSFNHFIHRGRPPSLDPVTDPSNLNFIYDTLLEDLANWVSGLGFESTAIYLAIFIWISVLLSSFIDNVPFTILMIPVCALDWRITSSSVPAHRW